MCCTLSSSGSPQLLECMMNSMSVASQSNSNRIQPISFDALIIDEAAQAVEPSTLIPLKYHPKVGIIKFLFIFHFLFLIIYIFFPFD